MRPCHNIAVGLRALQNGEDQGGDCGRSHDELGKDYGGFLTQLEAQLSSLCGHDEKEAVKHAGRADGRTYRMVDASVPACTVCTVCTICTHCVVVEPIRNWFAIGNEL